MIENIELVDGNVLLTIKGDSVISHWDEPKVFVTGVGHSGTNLLLAMAMATKQFNCTILPEDRYFSSGVPLLFNYKYLAKLACDSKWFILPAYHINMEKFLGLKTLMVVRHPLDAALSGAYRGLPVHMGGDSERAEPLEYTKERAEEMVKEWATKHAPTLLHILKVHSQSNRVRLFRMEDILLHTHAVAKEISSFLDVECTDDMVEPWKYNLHKGQKLRYKGKPDTKQVDVYKRWKTEYDGFFADKEDFVLTLAEGLVDVASIFQYRIDL